ncbi:hypothetical protein K8O93_19115 [Gordonia bronchialis]|uniref:hypothetical protein n=1 Tax=Gordonia bronchialis TaxID=2054 RepID=UPI001CBFF992|nr:hypothetical protein [Gordonia bronchialis]UAK37241.1 hypothetical protein K8O93_19115 [Gordonia bronchialis]
MGDDSMDVGDLGYKALNLNVPLDSSDPGGVVRFSTVDWEARARVAEESAAKLEDVIDTLGFALPNNYFGDCVEGRQMYARARTAIDSWLGSLRQHCDDLTALAAQCRKAASQLDSADVSRAQDIET